MVKHSYEIEIKSLLGNKKNADLLVKKMESGDPGLQSLGTHKQLNHYFIGGDLKQLLSRVKDLVEPNKLQALQHLANQAKDFSVRTRWADGQVLLVIKASVNDDSSYNGTARLEWESKISATLEELDRLVLDSGFVYQAKWSRERQTFKYKNLDVTIDKNAGYGHLAEFEKQIEDELKAEETKNFIRGVMKELGLPELPQERLERMFAYYNEHWQDYYGTDKIFTIE